MKQPYTRAEIEDEEGPYFAGWVVCAVCGYRHVEVHPIGMYARGECPRCGAMACDPELG